jgi:AraC-like DNA-binding protein
MMLQIRNMESDRCIALVKEELDKLGLIYKTVELGEVELSGSVSMEVLQMVDIALKNAGLELISEKKGILIDKIKKAIHKFIFLTDDIKKPNFSEYISIQVNNEYKYLSHLFLSVQGITVEKYFIAQKMERVKELLTYSDSSLNEIAFKLKFSSVGHLSNQFKKVIGLPPSFFRKLRQMNPIIPRKRANNVSF